MLRNFLRAGAPHAVRALYIFSHPPFSPQSEVLPLHYSKWVFTPYCGRPHLLYIMFNCREDMTSYDLESIAKQLFGASVASDGRLTEDHAACTLWSRITTCLPTALEEENLHRQHVLQTFPMQIFTDHLVEYCYLHSTLLAKPQRRVRTRLCVKTHLEVLTRYHSIKSAIFTFLYVS